MSATEQLPQEMILPQVPQQGGIAEFDRIPEELAKFLVFIQGEGLLVIKNRIAKDGQGSVMYRYADLPQVFELIHEMAKERQIAIAQPIRGVAVHDGMRFLRICTRIIHASGVSWCEVGEAPIPPATQRQNAAQAWGSAVTFGRRYTLCAMLGIISGDDDDAKRAFAMKHETGPDAGDAPAVTWQSMFTERTFMEAPVPGEEWGETLADLPQKRIRDLVKSNARLPEPAPALVAYSASMLDELVKKKGGDLAALLKAANWKGPAQIVEMSATEILVCYNAILAVNVE